MLSHVFSTLFGATGGPEVGLFKRFQKQWSFINQAKYSVASDDLFIEGMKVIRKEMVSFYSDAIGHHQPREDYLELLQLCLVFLGGQSEGKAIQFRAPGALHHARWMSKAIYAIKIMLFQDQVKLTAREKSGLTEF